MSSIFFLGGNPFAFVERSAVLQEARIFQQTPINPRKCCEILTKIIYLINQGEIISTNEATETFFAMTKLFQSSDVSFFCEIFITFILDSTLHQICVHFCVIVVKPYQVISQFLNTLLYIKLILFLLKCITWFKCIT